MTFVNTEAAEKLRRREWRWLHSAWGLAVIFGFGLLSFVGFVYCALRVRTTRWWIRAAIACGLSATAWTVSSVWSTVGADGESELTTGAAWVIMVIWVGMMIWGSFANRDYLRWRATPRDQRNWYDQDSIAQGGAATTPAMSPQSALATVPGDFGIDTAQYYAQPQGTFSAPPAGPTPQPAPLPVSTTPAVKVNVNQADASNLVAAGVDAGLATRIVNARVRQGGFSSFESLVAAADVKPHELVRLRDAVVCGPSAQSAERTATAVSPRNDASGGRILDF